MMELKKFKLGEIGEVCMCKRIMKEETNTVSGIPFYKIGTFGNAPDAYISREKFEDYKRLYSFPKKGDILISAAGTIGRTVVFDGKDAYFQDSNIVWIDNDETKVLNRYLYYCYKNIRWYTSNGSTILRLYNDNIKNSEILVPDLLTQKQIVSVLFSLDRKIALNRAINRNLEAFAKQLYDYWFVQFDFPDENGRPYKSSGGKMVWNEGIQMSIPFGWNECRLSDFIGKNNTGDWGTDEPSGNSIEIGCIRGADILSLNDLPKRYIKSNKVEKLLTEWDVVIEVSGGSPVQATGRSAYITPGVIKRNGGNISCSNFCHAFSFKDYRDSAYFFYVWNMFYDNGIMFNYEGKTSGIKNFMTDVFLANKWINAPKTLIVKFYNVIKEIYAKMDANISENNSLVKQRDNLLPLLMNGQVEVKQLNSDL